MAAGTYFRTKMREYEKSLIISLLTETGGNIREAAAKVDERRRVIYRILKRHGINPNDFRRLGANSR
jgi:DNA-binding NtrC family response regulator